MAATSSQTAIQNRFVALPVTQMTLTGVAEHPATRFKKTFTKLGVTLLAIGITNFSLGLASLGLFAHNYSQTGSGTWDGCWYIVCGSLALASGSKPSVCNVVAGLVVSMITVFIAIGAALLEAFVAGNCNRISENRCQTSFVAIHALISTLAFIAFILAVIHSSYGFRGSFGLSDMQSANTRADFSVIRPNDQVPSHHNFVPVQPFVYQLFPQMYQPETANRGITTFSHDQVQLPYVTPPPYQLHEQNVIKP